MAKARRAKAKQVKKVWVEVLAPAIFNRQKVGEIPVADPQTIMGRVIPVNLMSLTRDMRNQNITVKFKVTEVNGTKAATEFLSYRINPSSLKKMVRRRKSKINMSSVFKTADGKFIRIKSLIITRKDVNNSVLTAIRNYNNQVLANHIIKQKYEDLGQEVSFHKLQNVMKKTMDKIYPLKIYEFNSLAIEPEKRAKKVLIEPVPMKEKPKKEEAPVKKKTPKASEKKSQEAEA